MNKNQFIIESLYAKQKMDSMINNVTHNLLISGSHRQRNNAAGVDFLLEIIGSPLPDRNPIIKLLSSANVQPWKLERYYTLEEGLLSAIFAFWSCCEYGIIPSGNIMIGDVTPLIMEAIHQQKKAENGHRSRVFASMPRFGYPGAVGGPLYQSSPTQYSRSDAIRDRQVQPVFSGGSFIGPANFRPGMRLDVLANVIQRWCPRVFTASVISPVDALISICNHEDPETKYTASTEMTRPILEKLASELYTLDSVRIGVSDNISETTITLKSGHDYMIGEFIDEVLKQGNPGHTRDEYMDHLSYFSVNRTVSLSEEAMHLFAFDYFLKIKFEPEVSDVEMQELKAKIQPKSKSTSIKGSKWLRQFGKNLKVVDMEAFVQYCLLLYPSLVNEQGAASVKPNDYWVAPVQQLTIATELGIKWSS